MYIRTVEKRAYPDLAALWEASVRATHDFLAEEDLVALRSQVEMHYLAAVDLRVCQNRQCRYLGFIGVSADKVEMLFVAPEHQRQGVGRLLLDHALHEMGATAVDVNEQNPRALVFYQRMGFVLCGRSAVDGQGRPYPLLHLRLANS